MFKILVATPIIPEQFSKWPENVYLAAGDLDEGSRQRYSVEFSDPASILSITRNFMLDQVKLTHFIFYPQFRKTPSHSDLRTSFDYQAQFQLNVSSFLQMYDQFRYFGVLADNARIAYCASPEEDFDYEKLPNIVSQLAGGAAIESLKTMGPVANHQFALWTTAPGNFNAVYKAVHLPSSSFDKMFLTDGPIA